MEVMEHNIQTDVDTANPIQNFAVVFYLKK